MAARAVECGGPGAFADPAWGWHLACASWPASERPIGPEGPWNQPFGSRSASGVLGRLAAAPGGRRAGRPSTAAVSGWPGEGKERRPGRKGLPGRETRHVPADERCSRRRWRCRSPWPGSPWSLKGQPRPGRQHLPRRSPRECTVFVPFLAPCTATVCYEMRLPRLPGLPMPIKWRTQGTFWLLGRHTWLRSGRRGR